MGQRVGLQALQRLLLALAHLDRLVQLRGICRYIQGMLLESALWSSVEATTHRTAAARLPSWQRIRNDQRAGAANDPSDSTCVQCRPAKSQL